MTAEALDGGRERSVARQVTCAGIPRSMDDPGADGREPAPDDVVRRARTFRFDG